MTIDPNGTALKLKTGMISEILPESTTAISLVAGRVNVGLDLASPANAGHVNVGRANNAGRAKIAGHVPALLTTAGHVAKKNSLVGTDKFSAFFHAKKAFSLI